MIRKGLLWRPCKCGKYFCPTSKESKTCLKCIEKARKRVWKNNKIRLELKKRMKMQNSH